MLKDELDEQRALEKSDYPSTSPLAAGEPSLQLEETTQMKETKEIVFQTTYVILVNIAGTIKGQINYKIE